MMGRHGRNLRQRVLLAEAEERDRIAAQARRRQAELELMNEMRRRVQAAEEFNRDVAEIVGRAAIIAGEPTHQMFDMLRIREAREYGIRVIPEERAPLSLVAGPMESYAMEQIRYEVLRMLDYEVVAEPMRRCMHMNVTLAGGEVRYTISDTALRTMGREKIARDLVRALLDGLFKKLGR